MTPATRRWWRAALPIVATISFLGGVAVVLAFARDTLGYDYQAYVGAASRLLDGRPLYDTAVDIAGPFAIYLYPPPFAVAFIPFAVLPSSIGVALWTALSIAMVAGAIAILPVRAEVRWVVLLLAGIDWPVVYAIKLGQVGPLLLLAFAAGWRWLERPPMAGGVAAIGTLVKLQPALLFGWGLLAWRPRTVVLGAAVLVGVVLVTLPLVGFGAYADYLEVIRRVTNPVTTPNNDTPGALLYRAGLTEGIAAVVQVASVAAVLLAWVAACRWRSPVAGYLATGVACQLISPLLWEHYAMFLLLPTALLLEWRRAWAVLIPLATSSLLAWTVPGLLYAVLIVAAFVVSFGALLLVRPTGGPGREPAPLAVA